MSYSSLEPLFHPSSIALVGITVTNPEHWTRTFYDALLGFGFKGPIYLVNTKGGEIGGCKVYRNLDDIPYDVDYVISTVPARAAPGLVEKCAGKRVKAIHFCTAGFSETGDEEGLKLETELAALARKTGVRIIGPNCMGIYCPESRLSFEAMLPKESGPVGFVCQSGGNAENLVRRVMLRGVRFSKVISYGNACDLNESDFLEYLAADTETRIVALYVEGVKDGRKFRRVLQEAAREKIVVLLKGGITEGGARAAASHTGSLSGNEKIWDSLCKQFRVIQVHSLEEMADTLVTLVFMSLPKGRRVALIGAGGGASVLITDEFEKRGLKVVPLPEEMVQRIRKFTPIAGNILRNPIDYSQNMLEIDKLVKTFSIISRWEGIDFLVWFMNPAWIPQSLSEQMHEAVDRILAESQANSKSLAIMVETSLSPEEAKKTLPFVQKCVSSRVPVYYSFASTANAISLFLNHSDDGVSV